MAKIICSFLTDTDEVFIIRLFIGEQTNESTHTQRVCDPDLAHILFPTSGQPRGFPQIQTCATNI